MLRISKLADYGTVVMVYLATQSPKISNARDIALQTHLALPTVSKLLKRLTAAGLLRSSRGMMGGYRLQRPPAEMSVLEIIHALEDTRGLTECSLQPNACALQGVCRVQGNWQLISQSIEEKLGSVSLEALANPLLSAGDLSQLSVFTSGIRRG